MKLFKSKCIGVTYIKIKFFEAKNLKQEGTRDEKGKFESSGVGKQKQEGMSDDIRNLQGL
jgi:hypothetical protein